MSSTSASVEREVRPNYSALATFYSAEIIDAGLKITAHALKTLGADAHMAIESPFLR
jgi:hypothetical protein